ncbi:MAG: dihydropyrimidinase [Oscillospiraceae bacterium]|nr:dihydropyrimidinase [Oscillospiraceae bacterium]
MDLLIKNGTVVNSNGRYKADVAVKSGKVVAVGIGLDPQGAEIVDATDLLVLPGGLDVHTHLELPVGDTLSADDYMTGTRAAACGGVTMVIDFVMQGNGQGLLEAVKGRDKLAAPKACVDYGFHVAITDLTDDILDEMESAVNMGVTSFKVFMTYAFGITDGVFYKVLRRSKDIGALVMVHAENHDVLEIRKAEFIAQGKTSAWYHYLSRPEFVESEADIRAIELAKSVGAPLYIVHLGCEDGMKAVEKARTEGYPIFAETCPHYLNFTCEVYKRPDGRNFVCSPPMKGQASQDALWLGIENGNIATVATDHCPFQTTEKDWGKDDFTKIPNGCMGIENLYPYLLSEANKGRISFERAVELCCANPAKLFGCAPQKGYIAPGSDADIVLYDPSKDFTISQKNMHSTIDYTIWEGVQLKGYPVRTYSKGALVYKDGEFVGKPGHGEFVKRNPVKRSGPAL